MAKTDEKVMKFVENELNKNPDASTNELFEKAKKVSSSIGKLTLRQFNARYPLQVKRRKSQTSGRKTRRRRTGSRQKASPDAKGREAVRQVFLSFASDLTAAQERKDLVKVLSNVNKYVDRAIKAASG